MSDLQQRLVALLVSAYDALDDIRPIPGLEEEDEELSAWLEEASAVLREATGRSVEDLVSEHLDQTCPWRTASTSIPA